MNRPEIRIITPQSEEIKPADISRSEQEALLAKYGYSSLPNSFSTYEKEESSLNNNLTFDEMVRLEEQKLKEEEMRRAHKMSGPKPITFEGDYSSETKYGDSDGFHFKINVVTNIK